MRISVVSAHASPLPVLGDAEEGGQDVHVADLAAALVTAGHDVVVHTRRDSPRAPAVVRSRHGYDVVHVPAGPPSPVHPDDLLPHLDEFTRFLRAQWRADRPDVVHAHYWTSGVASVLAANGLDLPVVQTFHSLGAVAQQAGDEGVPEARLSTERLIGREASRVVAQSTDERAQLVGLGVARTRVAVVPPGVDVRRFKPDGPTLNRTLPHRLVSPSAGADDVITALRSVWDTELVVVGGRAEDVRGLREHARACGVGDRVRLVGRVPRVAMPALLRSSDVVVCAGADGAVTPLEAMACGVPVVAATVGGATDTVVDGVTGLLVPPDDPRTLARVLRPLLADEARRDAYGIAAADRVEARYSTARIATETVRVYQQAAGLPQAVEASAHEV
ncbi:glycosyltransferase involved in cell wall biosynthesis [Saccharothrix saharensis]|uniref:Glycosyltransferase involved in cell wall biosynthesis n=1 Tax=Saccharothrix saharensis TaxID=571190 RepID=A0A543JPY0_9PSEU|nr:glycosyltransferase [Saccharothrix saharensis]TQM84883.1 glycosyltransferase involved in cell wall biosynthesis [Saccharothrix saharensis]